LEKIGKKLEPLIKNPKAVLSLNASDKQAFREMAQTYNELLPVQKKLKDDLEAIKRDVEMKANPMVNAKKVIEKGVEIFIGPIKEVVDNRIFRPVTIIKHSRRDCFRYLPKHSLQESVREIERKIIHEEEEAAKRAAMEKRNRP